MGPHFGKKCFIALMHLTLWTVSYYGDAIRPSQTSEKDMLCFTGGTSYTATIRLVARSTSFLARECDIIASFSFGICAVLLVLESSCKLKNFDKIFLFEDILCNYLCIIW